MFGLFGKPPPVGTVAINMRPEPGPWGGSSAFVKQLQWYLEHRGYRVVYNLKGSIDVIILTDPRDSLQNKTFGMEEIIRYRRENRTVKILHRINECDQRKATKFMDKLLADANGHADFTVFISDWLRGYHSERWFDAGRPHAVIYNGADPAIFHPIGSAAYRPEIPFRLVTHHWSNNPMKGFEVYRELDTLIAEGGIKGVEFWIIGRWPDDINWRSAVAFDPMDGQPLANKLRACHAYLTASLWEPCGMHHVEGAQCGLPLLYHADGGGIVEAGEKYGVGFREDIVSAIQTMQEHYTSYKDRVLRQMPSGDRMAFDYADIIQGLVASSR